MSALQVYNSLLPLTKEDSPMSTHYAKYVPTGYRVEYIGRKRRNDCIKTIRVDRKREWEWSREWRQKREWEWEREWERREGGRGDEQGEGLGGAAAAVV